MRFKRTSVILYVLYFFGKFFKFPNYYLQCNLFLKADFDSTILTIIDQLVMYANNDVSYSILSQHLGYIIPEFLVDT